MRDRVRPADRLALWLSRITIWLVIIIFLFPVIWVVSASLGKGDTFYQGSVFPAELSFENYVLLFQTSENLNFVRAMLNSIWLCTGVSVIQLLMTGSAAYAFSRIRFRGRKNGLMFLLLIQMFPAGMAIAAIYTLLYYFNALDSIWALMLFLAGGSAFNIWILKGYMDALPYEIDEAAKVDGCNHWQIFYKVIIPMAMPMFAVIFLFSFIGTYSEFMISSAALQSMDMQTVAVALQKFINNQFDAHWTMFAAASVVASVPLMIVFLVLQKYIAGGLMAGGVKE
ncbi:MAG: sugar ABC transporter permease [Bacillota bacterium]